MTYRKRSLSPQARLELGCMAFRQQGFYGAITDLAASFGVSRWLVYHLLHVLVPVLLEAAQPKPPGPKPLARELRVDKGHLDRAIVTLRVAGNVPLEGIQRCLEEVLGTRRSIGYLSEVITQAQQEAAAFQANLGCEVAGTGLLDDLFVHRGPILVAVEPHSTALLLLSKEETRDGDTWGVRLLETQEHGFQFTQVASDQAKGIAAGVQAALGEDTLHQADVGHLFGEAARLEAQVERAAYKAIGEEAERWSVLDSAKSERVIAARIEAWETAPQKMEQAMSLYEDVQFLASELYGLFTPVGPDGVPRSRTAVQGDLDALLALLSEIPHAKVQDLRKRLATQQESLLGFWEDWERRLAELREILPHEEVLQALLLEYFLGRRKPSQAMQGALKKAKAFVETHLGEQAVLLREEGASLLDPLVRSSALVETANSWLRPYLNTRKGVSQGFLDLIRMYRNTRTSRRGKRKDHSPFDLLGVALPKDWLSLVGLPQSYPPPRSEGPWRTSPSPRQGGSMPTPHCEGN
jgi:hypothetical protein